MYVRSLIGGVGEAGVEETTCAATKTCVGAPHLTHSLFFIFFFFFFLALAPAIFRQKRF
jgi:hypothetical protein